MIKSITVFCCGGGTNSYGVAVGAVERGLRWDLSLFADTGNEKPHTYDAVRDLSLYLVSNGLPEIITVRAPNVTLEQDCLNRKALPSVAYGFKTCSQRFKQQPQDKFIRAYLAGIQSPDAKVVKLIGFDSDEPQRAKPYEGNRYPLIEWGWGRDECIDAIDRAGLKQPLKSACSFCPSSKKQEIFQLRRQYPDLAARAVAMERNAELTTVKGLGRNFAWGDLYAADDAQAKLFPDSPIDIDCGCYDGDSA